MNEELLNGGVGLVHTIVQEPRTFGKAELGDEMRSRFIETLNPRYSIQYWGWPATLIRAVTAAHAETDHFEEGKIAVTGGSKNGASPSVAIICDKRMTALHATVSPIWESPLRLCDKSAWKALNAFNEIDARKHGDRINHPFLGGTFGPIYLRANSGHGRSPHPRSEKDEVNKTVFLLQHFFDGAGTRPIWGAARTFVGIRNR